MTVKPAAPAPLVAREADRIWFTERLRPGIQFTEKMSGWAGKPVDEVDERGRFQEAADRGEQEGWGIDCTLTIVSDDLEGMLSEWQHRARLVGTVTIPRLSARPMTVRGGEFRLFEVRPDRVETRRLWYRMMLTPDGDARTFYLEGYKEVRNSFPTRAWGDLTTLYLTISTGGYGASGKVVRRGILRLSFADFLRQLTTIRARNAHRFVERVDGPARFVGFFAGIVFNTYGRALAASTVATPDAPPPRAPRGRDRVEPADPIPIMTSDGVVIWLTRYRGGARGPVMLVPGFTTVAASFDTPTVETNLVQYLCAEGFDVWLFDYRASPASPAVWTSFTIDDIARRDYPAAVEEVFRRTGEGRKVQIVAHCVGSISLTMALLEGRLQPWVRSVILSQVAGHMVTAEATELKALYLATLLRVLGVKNVTASFNSHAWGAWFLDNLLKLYPTRERCSNPVCRRLLFIFHEIYHHEQLNAETHDALWRWFGTSSIAALGHLSVMVRTGRIVDGEGQDVYLTEENRRRLRLPISFMHGAINHVFPPAATQKTLDWLCEANDPRWYRRQEFPGYSHMDCFIGRSAAEVVFRWILGELSDPPHP